MFTFTNREEYLAYKADWKNRYFDTIKELRASAQKRREAERAFTKVELSSNEFWPAYNAMISARSSHRDLKQQATNLLCERFESKRVAGIQREERLRSLGILV